MPWKMKLTVLQSFILSNFEVVFFFLAMVYVCVCVCVCVCVYINLCIFNASSKGPARLCLL